MRNRILYSVFFVVVLALAMAPALFGQDARAAQVLEASRQAIGARALDSLRTLSVEYELQRNLHTMQISSDVEILVELPDKYARIEQPNAPGVVGRGMTSGFNGDRALQPVQGGFAGGMVIRMGGPATAAPDLPKPTPEEQERLEKAAVRSHKHELARLMLGWFAMAHPSLAPQYTYAGEAESSDTRASMIDVTDADGFAARLFIDQRTNLPLMVSYKAPQRQIVMAGGPGRGAASGASGHGGMAAPRGGAAPASEEERKRLAEDAQKRIAALQNQPPALVEYTLYFDDWQPVDGIRFPRTIRRASEGTTTEEWTIGTVRVNPKIDAKKFEVKG